MTTAIVIVCGLALATGVGLIYVATCSLRSQLHLQGEQLAQALDDSHGAHAFLLSAALATESYARNRLAHDTSVAAALGGSGLPRLPVAPPAPDVPITPPARPRTGMRVTSNPDWSNWRQLRHPEEYAPASEPEGKNP